MSVEFQMNEKTVEKLLKRVVAKMTADGVLEPVVEDKSFPGVIITVTSKFKSIANDTYLEFELNWADKKIDPSNALVSSEHIVKDGIPAIQKNSHFTFNGGGPDYERQRTRAVQLLRLIEIEIKTQVES